MHIREDSIFRNSNQQKKSRVEIYWIKGIVGCTTEIVGAIVKMHPTTHVFFLYFPISPTLFLLYITNYVETMYSIWNLIHDTNFVFVLIKCIWEFHLHLDQLKYHNSKDCTQLEQWKDQGAYYHIWTLKVSLFWKKGLGGYWN